MPPLPPARDALLRPATLGYLRALISGDWAATRAVDEPTQRQASGLIAAFVGWHTERGLRTLGLVER